MPDITGDGINDLDITAAGSSTTKNGAIFTDAVNVGSGTGGYNTFLAIQDNNDAGSRERGFNSDDANPLNATNNEIDHSKTHTVQLSDIVIVTVNGVQYYEFRVDLNESNSAPNTQISLDQFRIFAADSSTIESTATLFGGGSVTEVYNMDTGGDVSVLLSEANSSGSGTDDYAVLVPVSNFAGVDPDATIYLFVEMGAAGAGWETQGGFEEWNLQNAVTLTGTKFNDVNGNGIRDAGEAGVGGVTIFIDSNSNGSLDAGERSTVTAADGTYSFNGVGTGITVRIDEVIPAGATQTTGAFETVIIAANAAAGSTIVVDPIGNHLPQPDLTIVKSVLDVDGAGPGGSVDAAGDVISYRISVTNSGDVVLSGLAVTDTLDASVTAVDADLNGFNDGDVNNDGVFNIGESWLFDASYTATQGDIDDNGGGDGDIDNTATADTDQTDPENDSASVPIVQNPDLTIVKSVLDVDGAGPGGSVDAAGDVISYRITVTNSGNMTLTGLAVTDTLDPSVETVDADLNGFNDGDSNNDGVFNVGESWLFDASYTATQGDIDDNGGGDGDIDNTATADTNETDPENDSASVPIVQNPDLTIVKSVLDVDGAGPGGSVDAAGDVISYRITVTNSGNVALTGLTVTDTLDPSVVTVDADLNGFNDGDVNNDGVFNIGESWLFDASYTATQGDIDDNGGGDGDIDNTATADTDQTDPENDSASVPIVQNPDLTIVKSVLDVDGAGPGGSVDAAGDVISYRISVTNSGNMTLTGLAVTDTLDPSVIAVDADLNGFNDGDINNDGLFNIGESWLFDASYTATQGDIDTNGGGDGDIDNTATADTDQTDPENDSASVPIVQSPDLTIVKSVLDVDGAGPGGSVDAAGDVISYRIEVTNSGNMTLTGLAVTDTLDPSVTAVDADLNGFNDGDVNNDGLFNIGESWLFDASYTATQGDIDSNGGGDGDIDNTATADTDQTDPENDSASVPILIIEGPGVRTPGFWSNLGATFWDGVVGNEPPQAGTDGFPDGELLYAVDSNNDGSVGAGDVAGLLIGDYNHNGLTDAGEDTLFIGLSDAKTLISASNKTVGGDGRFMLGRDMVATWLNSLAGNGIGDASDLQSPHHYLDDGIDWMQIFSGSVAGGTSETFDTFKLAGNVVRTNSAFWNTPQFGIDHSASQIHSALDHYNNTGQTEDGGTIYAPDVI